MSNFLIVTITKWKQTSNNQIEFYFNLHSELTNKTQNIFTILKNGELHIGGIIQDMEDKDIELSKSLPTDIKVTESGIKIEGGYMYMDLSKFRDMSTGDDILNIINSTVADASVGYHAHEIKQLNLKIKDTPSEYSILPTKVTAPTWKSALGEISIDGNINNISLVFGRLIDLLAGNTVEFDSDKHAKYNPVCSGEVAPMLQVAHKFPDGNPKLTYSYPL